MHDSNERSGPAPPVEDNALAESGILSRLFDLDSEGTPPP
jgi:hypothetical protein